MNSHSKDENLDQEVIKSFGHEWASFNYTEAQTDPALDSQFAAYCAPIDLTLFDSKTSIAADFGAGSGRWTSRLLPFFSTVYALEPSGGAIRVLQQKFSKVESVIVLQETVGFNTIEEESLDFAMSLGVLHHIPDTHLAIENVSEKIKPGGYLLCYLYYKLENKPLFYRILFRVADMARIQISRLPHPIKSSISKVIAAFIYWPLARLSKILFRFGINTSNVPLHHYAEMPFVMLANDALDRFGTSLEQRFNKAEITEMLKDADFDLDTLVFSDIEPYWTFAVRKNSYPSEGIRKK